MRRHILDLDSDWLGRFNGTAWFRDRGDGGLSYFEEGHLQFAGLHAVRATRTYHWHFDGDIVQVSFEDGSAFHHFDLTEPRAEASHYCDPDLYEVTYDFRRWPEWRAEWRVEGPRKDYRLVSVMTRP